MYQMVPVHGSVLVPMELKHYAYVGADFFLPGS
jgi:hypothetical protein